MIIFGNDGFRSEFGKKYMTYNFILSLATSLGYFYKRKNFVDPILIGRDTRETGVIINKILSSVFSYMGIDSVCSGIVSTPVLSNILINNKFSIGIMITASHDPSQNNGIKLFAKDGFKLDQRSEKSIESQLIKLLENNEIRYSSKLGSSVEDYHLTSSYIQMINNQIKKNISGSKLLIDCSNGSYSGLINKIDFGNIGLKIINNKPNGYNINKNCGALELNKLFAELKKIKYDFAVAFDGDGDRIIFYQKEYGFIEPEKLMLMFSELENNNSKKNIIVSSEICNKGLEVNCKKLKYSLIQTEVGDRTVVNTAFKNKALLGAEPSGHYYFPNETRTMDGLLTLTKFINLLDYYGGRFLEKLNDLKHYKRFTANINEKYFSNLDNNNISKKLNSYINKNEEKLIIRKSMWEPVYRIYFDYKTKKNLSDFMHILENKFHVTLN